MNMVGFVGFNKNEPCCKTMDEAGKIGLCHFIDLKSKCKTGKRSVITIIAVWKVAMVAVI